MTVSLITSRENKIYLPTRTAILVGLATIILVFTIGISENQFIEQCAHWLGGEINDFFLISTNLLIILWAWKKRLFSAIVLTLKLDLMACFIVQCIKLIHVLPALTQRPNGELDGFPSGHATQSFALAFLLTLFFPRFAWLWYLCAISISWARLETLSHSGIQIASGVILGTFLGWLLVNRWLKKTEARVYCGIEG